MLKTRHVLMGVGMVLLLSGALAAQGVISQRNLSLSVARTIAEAAHAECKSNGFNIAVAVVDRTGQVLVLLRDEQAAPQLVEVARRKAFTAQLFRVTTMEFRDRTIDPALAPQRNVPDILALGGGVPIQAGSDTLGGVGSAGANQENDDACSKAGLERAAGQLNE